MSETQGNTSENDSASDNWPGIIKLRKLRDELRAMAGLVRLSVNINSGTAKALKEISEEAGISHTETIRRAISVASFLYSESRNGRRIVVSDKKGRQVKEIFLD